MVKERFTTNGYKIYDKYSDGDEWLLNGVDAEEIVKKMNNLDIKARERSIALSKLQKENEQLKSAIKDCMRISESNGALSPMRLKSIFYHFKL